MAITVGATISNSGNQAASSGFSFNHTTDANTKALVVVVTGMDSSDTDSAVSGITFDGVALTHPVTRYRNGSVFIDIWYKSNPAIASAKAIAVTMGGACTDVQASAVNLVDASAVSILYDSTDTGTGTGSASGIVNPARTGSYAVGGGVAQGGTTTSLSVTTGTEASGSEVDMGNQTASVGYVAEASGSATITWTYSAVQCDALAATFYSQFAPTVVLNTPADAGSTSDTTPDLVFTGTDLNADELEYNVQIDTASGFDSGLSFNLKYVDLYLAKGGSPTDDLILTIRSTSFAGSSLGASEPVAASSLSASPTYGYIRFTFATPVPLDGAKYYMTLARTGARDTTNRALVGLDLSDAYSGGGPSVKASGSWPAEGTTTDLTFKIFDDSTVVQIEQLLVTAGTQYQVFGGSGTNEEVGQSFTAIGSALLNKLSVTPDATFTGTGDPHPWPSGNQVTYTVQAGDALTAGTTYYWRVRAIDPTGSNTYGAWATTRSFTVAATSNPRSGMWNYLPILAQ